MTTTELQRPTVKAETKTAPPPVPAKPQRKLSAFLSSPTGIVTLVVIGAALSAAIYKLFGTTVTLIVWAIGLFPIGGPVVVDLLRWLGVI